jgi:Short C-terminal domain
MPGLLRGVARTAAIAGTASAVSGRVARHQAEHFAERDQAIAANRGAGYEQGVQQAYAQPAPPPPPPAPAAAGQDDMLAQLEKLGSLKAAGILTEEEFAAQKAKILAG